MSFSTLRVVLVLMLDFFDVFHSFCQRALRAFRNV